MPSHDVTQLAHDGTTALPKLARKPYMQIGSKVFYCHLNEGEIFLQLVTGTLNIADFGNEFGSNRLKEIIFQDYSKLSSRIEAKLNI